MLGRVELLTNGWNRRQALRLEGLLELASHQLDALEPVSVDSFRGVVERPLEVVQDRKQLAEQLLVRVLGPIRELLAGAALVILEVRGEPLILRKGRLDFIAGGLQLRVNRLRLAAWLRARIGGRAGPGIDHALARLAARLIGRMRLR